jgi:hypothetical protein
MRNILDMVSKDAVTCQAHRTSGKLYTGSDTRISYLMRAFEKFLRHHSSCAPLLFTLAVHPKFLRCEER